jgi:alkanesulfonate monooxygenase SsuD/methylene tetrahydromethanopterin reductase-like flavin-dependent oxidoreductase (luciferase family)
LRLAEDLALLDHITGGRLEIGVGRGNYGLEAQNLNPIADPNNQAQNVKVFVETVEIMKKALSQERFSHKGEIYQFPAPGFSADRAHSVDDPAYIDERTGELVKLSIFPRAKQQPMPPLWQVVSESLDSLRYAAQGDMGAIMWRPTVKALKERLRIYKEAYEEATGQPIPFGARTAIVRDTFVAQSKADARRIAGDAVMSAMNFANWRGPRIYLDPGETLDPALEAQLRKQLTFDFVDQRALLFGSPEDVHEKLEELRRETSIEQVIFKCSYPGLEHRHTMQSMHLLIEEVLPRLRGPARKRTASVAVSAAE